MSNVKKLMMTAAGGGGLNVEDVFSTYLYTGTGSTQTITNDIDLDGEGGLVWLKARSESYDHIVFDTNRGDNVLLTTNNGLGNNSGWASVFEFNNNGFSAGSIFSNNSVEYASWTFRKAPKFFDVVTYTGTGSNQTISHNLGSTPGMIIIKVYSQGGNWVVWHRGIHSTSSASTNLSLNTTGGDASPGGQWIANVGSSSFDITAGSWGNYNQTGQDYVVYLFAHNDGDGEFGPTGDQDIIKCGSYTGNGSTNGPEIDLGFEPQWLLVKRNGSANWVLIDSMRGFVHEASDKIIMPNGNNPEYESSYLIGGNMANPLPTGFKITEDNATVNSNGNTYVYIAIRRGPMAVPESATDVFAIDEGDNTGSSSNPQFYAGWPVDMGINKTTSGSNSQIHARLTDQKVNYLNYGEADGNSVQNFDFQEAYYGSDKPSGYYSWMWRRAPNFFDVVCYTGDGTAGRDIPHNLGVTPEMIWAKKRGSSTDSDWAVYHTGLAQSYHYIRLNLANAFLNDPQAFDSGNHTATTFSVGLNARTNGSDGIPYIAYLFASLDGISKVGSYTGTGSTLNVDCGFSNGAKFVLIKNASDSGTNWVVFDTERGIVSGNDPKLEFNTTAGQVTGYDWIDPYSSGFTVNPISGYVNSSGNTYIFYAIAA